MDVNDLGSAGLPLEIQKEVQNSTRARTSSAELNNPAPEPADPEISIQIDETNQPQTSDLRSRANQVITIVNLTSTATDEIQRLVESISGIVEQSQHPDLSDTRRSALEREANQLVGEIKAKAQITESNGVRPLLGDTIRFDVEQRFGHALEMILPDTAKDAFGLGQMNLSLKDTIIDTITRVEQAKKQFEQLRLSVDDASTSVKNGVATFEVALQNTEASKATIRSLDQALSIATKTHKDIGKNPEQAIGSFGKLDLASATLLR